MSEEGSIAEQAALEALLEAINSRLPVTRVVSTGARTRDTYVDMPLLRLEVRPEFAQYDGSPPVHYDDRVLDGLRRAVGGAFTDELSDQVDLRWGEAAIKHCALDTRRANEITSALTEWPAFDEEDRRFLSDAADGDDSSLDELITARLAANHAALVWLAEQINDDLKAHMLEPSTVVSSGYGEDRWNGLGVFRLGYKPHKPGQEIHDEEEMNDDVRLFDELTERTLLVAFAEEIDDSGSVPFKAPDGIVLLCNTSDPQAVLEEFHRLFYDQ